VTVEKNGTGRKIEDSKMVKSECTDLEDDGGRGKVWKSGGGVGGFDVWVDYRRRRQQGDLKPFLPPPSSKTGIQQARKKKKKRDEGETRA